MVKTDEPFSPEELEQLARLTAMPDDDIDLSDIPELTGEQWKWAFRPGPNGSIKQSVTIRLDIDIVNWLKDQAGDKPIDTEINRVLRQQFIAATRPA